MQELLDEVESVALHAVEAITAKKWNDIVLLKTVE